MVKEIPSPYWIFILDVEEATNLNKTKLKYGRRS